MGQELRMPELPANSPRPPETPSEGIIVVDADPDGYTRRYLYKAMHGVEPSEVLISESPTMGVSGRAAAVQEPPRAAQVRPQPPRSIPVRTEPPRSAPVRMERPAQPQKPMMTPLQEKPSAPILQVRAPMAPQMGASTPVLGLHREEQVRPKAPVLSTPVPKVSKVAAAPLPNRPQTQMLQIRQAQAPQIGSSMMAPQEPQAKNPKAPVGGPTAFLEKEVRLVALGGPSLGNVPQKNSLIPSGSLGQAAPVEPAAPLIPPGECPGAVEMPDGRVIQPEDTILLSDLCELLPFLFDWYSEMQKAAAGNGPLAPGKNVPIAGQPQGGPGAVPTQSQFGPAGGGGGGGFVGGGGGGPGPTGLRGAPGAAGPPGFGGIVDSVTKIDGDFTAGPGAFIAVPGTLVPFVQATAGPATFLVNATFGTTSGAGSTSQSGQLGIRVDGTDYPLVTRLLHTFVGGVAEFLVGQPAVFVLVLPAGAHSVEIITRGLVAGEFGGNGLGIPLTVSAVPAQPLFLSVSHN